jgi:PAS domain S-box-containing protein
MSDDGWPFDELHPDAYRMLVEGVPAILYIDRPDDLSTNLYTSPQIESLLGYPLHEWMADPELWKHVIHPDDLARVLAANEASNRTGGPYLEEYRVLTKDGRTVWIRDEAAPVRGADGTLLYWRGVILDITQRKEAEERLRWSLEVLRRTVQQRRELARRLQNAQEAERQRIAADIHDDPIQVMSAVDLRLQMLAEYPETITTEALAGIEAEVSAAIDRLRSMLFELRPAALDREGLVPALRLYLDRRAKTSGWDVEVVDRMRRPPDPDLAALLYRIGQEAIVNVARHAGASRLKVEVVTAGDGVTLRIQDDGVGFIPDLDAPPAPGHLGVSTMVERAELAGGWARIVSAPGEGTTVECWLPLDAASGDSALREPAGG